MIFRLVNAVSKQFRRLARGRKESSHAELADFEHEQFLFFNQLVGSSPEREQQYRDLRIDLIEAVKHGSSTEFCIALKRPPLRWEDRFAAIVEEIALTEKERLIACLLPPVAEVELNPDSDPLAHSDWRVRSNAAGILARLQETRAIERMIACLHQCAENQAAAFCHVARALAAFQAADIREALQPYLLHTEEWFRINAAYALARWGITEVEQSIFPVYFSDMRLRDYLAVAISRNIDPAEWANCRQELSRQALLEMSGDLCAALEGTFANEAALEVHLEAIIPLVAESVAKEPGPRSLSCALTVLSWLKEKRRLADYPQWVALEESGLFSPEVSSVAECIVAALTGEAAEMERQSELCHAINLAGRLRIREARPLLETFLQIDCPWRDYAIVALGNLAEPSVAPELIALSERLVNLSERTKLPFSAQPVFEEHPDAVKSYWNILLALGNLPCTASVDYLYKASNDFAPDKRLQAMCSLSRICAASSLPEDELRKLIEVVQNGLADPWVHVRDEALDIIGENGLAQLIPDVIKHIGSKEGALHNRSIKTLKKLIKNGRADAVTQFIKSSLSKEFEPYRRACLQDVLSEARH